MEKTKTNPRVHNLTLKSKGFYSFEPTWELIPEPNWDSNDNNYRSFTDTRTVQQSQPGWRRAIAEHRPAFTYLYGTKTKVRFKPGYHYIVDKNFDGSTKYYVYADGNMFASLSSGSSADDTAIYNKADSLAMTSFISRCRKAQTAFGGGQFIGELRETLHGIRNPAKTLRESLVHYRNKLTDRKTWRRSKDNYRLQRRTRSYTSVSRRGYHGFNDREIISRTLRDSWLEYSFSIKPLVADIEDASKALRRLYKTFSGQPAKLIASERVPPFIQVNEDLEREGSPSSQSRTAWSYRELSTNWATVQYRGFVNLQVDATGMRTLQQSFGVATQDFVPTLWEIFPYSFLVDYFTNIGDMISVMSFNTAALGVVYKTVRKGSHVKAYDARAKPAYNPSFRLSSQFDPGQLEIETQTVSRDRFFGPFVPTLAFTFPGLSTKWLNIAALAKMKRIDLETRSFIGLRF